MSNVRDKCFREWGRKCYGCGAGIGIEVHHIDGNRENNDLKNLMPLCGTCHNLVTTKIIYIEPDSRKITVNFLGLFILGPSVNSPPHTVQVQLFKFKETVNVLEVRKAQPFLLLQDGVNRAYFVECHVQAKDLVPLLYEDTVLNPDDLEDPDAEEYKLNREIVELSAVFRRMQDDAERGRPFSDIIVEFNQNYEPDNPLKIIAGQHRASAIKNAVNSDKEEDRVHGIKVYFDLSKDQRAEISLISNTNIAISKQLIDRFGEQHIGPESRKWCQEVGLLEPGKDFADRITGSDRFTVQILRALIINFYLGKCFEGDIYESLHDQAYIPSTGSFDPDKEYRRILQENTNIWKDPAVADMGRMFALLSSKQEESCISAPNKHKELRKVAFRYKTFTPAIAIAWAYVSGLLQRNQARLKAHYQLPNTFDNKKSPDPLNARTMTTIKHQTADEPTYRGLGTRQSPKDVQRLVELFLLHSKQEYSGTITRELLELAVATQVDKKLNREKEELEEQARLAAERVRKKQDSEK